MKVFVLIKDETDYNGDRDVFGVYDSYDAAKAWGIGSAKRLKIGQFYARIWR